MDIIAACLVNKSIMFHQLKSDQHVLELKCFETPISLAFRSDRNDTLIVGGDKGSITVWNTACKLVWPFAYLNPDIPMHYSYLCFYAYLFSFSGRNVVL